MSAIAIRFPFTMRMSVAHKWEVEQTVCGREVVRGTCTQLSAGRVGAAASPGQGREPGNSLSQGSWLSLCPSICGHLGSTHGGHALYQEVQELKTLQLPSGSLWAAEKSLLRREAIALSSKGGLWTSRSCWRSQATFSWRGLGKTSERKQN